MTVSDVRIDSNCGRLTTRQRIARMMRNVKADLRVPLPEAAGQSLPRRTGVRSRYLLKKYGWKIVAGIFIFYLIRDLTLYVLIPYLIATNLF